MKLVEKQKVILGYAPAVYNGAACTAKYVSMKNYNHLTIILMTGAFAGARAVTINKATNVAAADAEAHRFTKMWTDSAANGTFVETAVTGNTFNTGVANSFYIIEIDAADLLSDATSPYTGETTKFDCVSLEINNVAAADAWSVTYILSEPRYSEADALLD